MDKPPILRGWQGRQQRLEEERRVPRPKWGMIRNLVSFGLARARISMRGGIPSKAVLNAFYDTIWVVDTKTLRHYDIEIQTSEWKTLSYLWCNRNAWKVTYVLMVDCQDLPILQHAKWLSSQAVAKNNARRGYFFLTVWPGRHLGGITLGIFTSSSRYLLCSTCLNKCVVAVAVRFDISTAKNKLSSWGKSRSAAVTSDAPAASKGRSKNDWAKQRKREQNGQIQHFMLHGCSLVHGLFGKRKLSWSSGSSTIWTRNVETNRGSHARMDVATSPSTFSCLLLEFLVKS